MFHVLSLDAMYSHDTVSNRPRVSKSLFYASLERQMLKILNYVVPGIEVTKSCMSDQNSEHSLPLKYRPHVRLQTYRHILVGTEFPGRPRAVRAVPRLNAANFSSG